MSKTVNREIGQRAAAEIRQRAADEDTSYREQEKRLGFESGRINNWEYGAAPSAIALAAMYRAGYDVIYILTGERSRP